MVFVTAQSGLLLVVESIMLWHSHDAYNLDFLNSGLLDHFDLDVLSDQGTCVRCKFVSSELGHGKPRFGEFESGKQAFLICATDTGQRPDVWVLKEGE